jgi:periplasmic divalent cation tolerance protein
MNEAICVVLTTLPSPDEARRVAGILVGEQLAACGSVLPGVESVYWWEGRVTTGHEALLVLKTPVVRYPDLEARLRTLHPYEVPEILRLGVDAGWPPYLEWVWDSVLGSKS